MIKYSIISRLKLKVNNDIIQKSSIRPFMRLYIKLYERKRAMKKKILTRLTSGAAAFVIAVTGMHLSDGFLGLRTYAADSGTITAEGIYNGWDDVSGQNVNGYLSRDAVTLLAGDDNGLAGSTVSATITNYENTYLLGIAAEFCVFLEDKFVVRESDAEGRVAIGGNFYALTRYQNYSVGAGDYQTHASLEQLLKNGKGAAHIIIGGQMDGRINDVYYEGYEKFESEADHTPTKKTKTLVLNTDTRPVDGYPFYFSIIMVIRTGMMAKKKRRPMTITIIPMLSQKILRIIKNNSARHLPLPLMKPATT